MTNAKKPPGKKLLGFPGSQDSVETELLRWVRGVVLSNDQLVDALEHLRSSYKVLQTGKSVPDAAETLWEVETACATQKDPGVSGIEIPSETRRSITTSQAAPTLRIWSVFSRALVHYGGGKVLVNRLLDGLLWSHGF